MRRRPLIALLALVITTAIAATGASAGATAPGGSAGVPPQLRVDQLGYPASAPKVANLMTARPRSAAAFRVVDTAGRTVLRGRAGTSTGPWSATYREVRPLDLTPLRAAGTYRVESLGARSPWFRVAGSDALYRARVADAVAFFQAQRDGADIVPGPLRRKPSHLNDAHAQVYDWPTYSDPDSDVIVGSRLHPTGAVVDVEGGWFDAGDFVKFAHTAAYSDVLLMVAQRELGGSASPGLAAETRYGLQWLAKAWEPAQDRLVIQVGIGSGNETGTFFGDHDLWRLPEVDDSLTGSADRYLAHRPVFVTDARPGRLAPNLAGRLSAAFALAAQLDAVHHPARARAELATAAQVFGRARTHGVTEADVVTALPHAFYPESAWRDDLELGAAELARAAQALGDPRAGRWLAAARHWAAQYATHEAGDDTLNLYDVSALAHAELAAALHDAGDATSGQPLVADLRRQLGTGEQRAAADPFGLGGNQDDFDVASHTFGLSATASLYRSVTGSTRFQAFGGRQLGWVLGANAWGQSLMIGVGTSYPRCPQHVVANLAGDSTGRRILRGAVVNGPNDASLFDDGLDEFFDNGRTCPASGVDRNAPFNGHGSAYVDDVRSWQTVEPADDFTATAALAFALAAG